jgi:menaquinone-dependent protoporphyrinogen oxidase
MRTKKKVLLLYSTRDGHALKIAETIATIFDSKALDYDFLNLDIPLSVHPDQYQAVLIVAAIRYGRFSQSVLKFARTYQNFLNNKPTGFLGVCLIARKLKKRLPQHNIYLRKFLSRTQWRPMLCEAIAGALKYPQYRWWDRQLIRLIMSITGGETNTKREIVYTDWDQVKRLTDTFLVRTQKAIDPAQANAI